MSIVVTGATGHLGRLTVEALLARGVPASEIVATGRDTSRLAELAASGVEVRAADFADPQSLTAAFAGAEKLVLVSTNAVGTRLPNHRNAIDAALAAGVSQIVYTSIPYADTTAMKLAEEHRATEEYLQSVNAPSTVLRNSWYWENYTGQLPVIREHKALLGSAGDGRVSAASRGDYAEAAAAVVTSDGHIGAVYELGGDTAVTLTEIAEAFGKALGEQVVYADVPEAELVKVLTGAGIPAPMPEILADADVNLGRGALLVESGDLSRLIGHPTQSLDDAVQAAVAAR